MTKSASNKDEIINLNRETLDFINMNIISTMLAVKALINNHPQPEEVEKIYNQLLGQILCTSTFLDHPELKEHLYTCTDNLFKPPINIQY